MNLAELIEVLPVSQCGPVFPPRLLGAFRRKSITFCTGLTDEVTVVYWFQSKSFTIDLRLPDGNATEVLDRQGWVGDTLWNARETQLSWDVTSSYQPRNQWPEPASFSFIGNSILEFAPSGAYVEDWRQQAARGALLGLRLHEALNEATGEVLPLDGGLILAGEHVAVARSRLPGAERVLQNSGSLARALIEQALTSREIESYEVSVALAGDLVTSSTQSWRLGQPIVSGEFWLEHDGSVSLRQSIDGVPFSLRFSLDLHLRDCNFDAPTIITPEAVEWMQHESKHLTRNAVVAR